MGQDTDELEQPQIVAPITEAQWARILKGTKGYAILAKEEQQAWAGARAVRCGACRRTHLSGDPGRGYCVAHRVMVSDTFPKLCRQFESRA